MHRSGSHDTSLTCTHPFEWLEVHSDGVVFLCCPSWLNVPLGNLLERPLEALWNGPLAYEIRKTVLNGYFHRCNVKRCPRLQTQKPPVQLLSSIADPEVKRAIYDQKHHLLYGPRWVNLGFDGRCNLACPSCRSMPMVCTSVENDRIRLIAERVETELASSTVGLSVSGYGDPFASPAYQWLLTRVSPQRWPMLKEVRLHSNGLGWDSEAWHRLENLHSYVRHAEISIDAGSEAVYRENRGGDWQRLMMNLTLLADLSFPVTLSMVVQRNNYRDIPLLVALARTLGFGVYLSQLANWGTFSKQDFKQRSVRHLKGEEREEMCAILNDYSRDRDVDMGNLSVLLKETGA